MNAPSQPSHVIRLSAAWNRKEISADGSLIELLRVALPDHHALSEDAFQVIYERSFNAPTGLSDTDQLFIECSLFAYADIIILNEMICKPTVSPERRVETIAIAGQLRRFNQLTIKIPRSAYEHSSPASANLLIYAAS